ncbi:MAG TPA: trypsin-like peptidase domain-containing protein [Gemmataceae bacterium]|nr:trypsin-like peptidase domain-containing protein [Gemmataceae bacterium]
MRRALLMVFVGSCAFMGGAAIVGLTSRVESLAADQPAIRLPRPTSDVLQIGDRFEIVARKVSPAVVYIEATKPAGTSDKSRPVEESGSGVIIKVDGESRFLVLTNNHVIAKAEPDQITINLADGRLLHPGRIWADPESDVALLRLDVTGQLPTAPLGDSDSARVGQWVLAIGSPFGLNQTVTHGIVSALDRGQISLGSTIRIKDFLQTDAAINPGSSGGPLVNLDGEIIGINTAIASHNGNNSGVAFSIPVNLVKRVMRQLLEKGSVARGYLGLQLAQAFEPADALKLGLDRVRGALVETVYPQTPAANAGLRANDVILQVDGVSIRNENHLINLVSALAAGQKVRLQVWRDRKTTALDATVGDWSKGQSRFRATAKE